MAGSVHHASSLPAFQSGEDRLVYARYRDRPDDPLFYLKDGTANEVRALTKEHLECFMPECADRRLKVVARHPRRRDGFSHLPGTGKHGRESVFHEAGKALIARWVGERYPDVAAMMEQATEDKSRRADVMLTWPDGAQVAVEVQYAALTVREWRERHESYRAQGIVDLWLLGHAGKQLRRSTREQDCGDGGGLLRITDLQHTMAKEGVPLLWMNPMAERVGTVRTSEDVDDCENFKCTFKHDARTFFVAPHEVRRIEPYAEFTDSPLADCSLTRDGLVTPATAWLTGQRADLLTARAADKAAEDAHWARQERAWTARLQRTPHKAPPPPQPSAPPPASSVPIVHRTKPLTALQESRVRLGLCPRCGLRRDSNTSQAAHWLCGPG